MPRKIGDSASGSLGAGMELLGRKHANAKLQEYNRIPPQKALELGRELMREHPDIDTLIYGCPHWATIESIEPLEQEFGVNVIPRCKPSSGKACGSPASTIAWKATASSSASTEPQAPAATNVLIDLRSRAQQAAAPIEL